MLVVLKLKLGAMLLPPIDLEGGSSVESVPVGLGGG